MARRLIGQEQLAVGGPEPRGEQSVDTSAAGKPTKAVAREPPAVQSFDKGARPPEPQAKR